MSLFTKTFGDGFCDDEDVENDDDDFLVAATDDVDDVLALKEESKEDAEG